jgi:hypothetical protein
MSCHAGHRLLSNEQFQTFLEVTTHLAPHRASVGADELQQKVLAQECFGTVLLVGHDLQQHAAGDVPLRALLNDLEFNSVDDQATQIQQCDVAALDLIVQTTVRVLFYDTHFTHLTILLVELPKVDATSAGAARTGSIGVRRSLLHFGKPKRRVMGGAKTDIHRRVRCSNASGHLLVSRMRCGKLGFMMSEAGAGDIWDAS